MTFWKNLVVALVAAFALAACSSSNDNGGTTEVMEPEPQPMAVDTSGVHDDAMVEAFSATIQPGMSTTRGDVTYSCPSGGDACMVEVMADGMTTSTGGIATAANSETFQALLDKEGELDDVESDLGALEDQLELEEQQKAARTARLLFSALDAITLMPVTTVTLDRGELETATVTPFEADGTAPGTAIVATFTDAQTSSLDAMNGWKGEEYKKKGHTAHIYNNLSAGTTVDFATVYGPTVSGTINANLVGGSAFAPLGAGSKSHYNNRDDNSDADNAPDDFFLTPGTYAGAQGTWVCTGGTSVTPCISTVSGAGFALGGGTWTFTPASGAMAQLPDADYGYFGWWLHEDAEGKFHVGVFSDLVENTGVTVDITGLDGTATYNGSAAGKFASYRPSIQGGHFTADVELKAKFGGTVAHTISGIIDNFKGPKEGNDWSVELPQLTIATTGAIALNADSMPVWSDGDDAADAAGTWSGQAGNESGGGVPMTVVGTFEAEHGHIGRMAGGFGATHSGQ